LKTNLTGIILSGGKSVRMGQDKPFLEIGGIPIIQRIYDCFEKFFHEIIIVTNRKEAYSFLKAKIVSDLIEDRGALGGLYTGLFHSSHPYSFCVASDMPFLRESLIQYLIEQANGHDVIVPRTSDGLQPLHAIYSKNCLPQIRKMIDKGKFKIIDFYGQVTTKIVEESRFIRLDPTRESFININTPEELDFYQNRKKFTAAGSPPSNPAV
jgi:molybdopterin-guanine dinucleotide biosynthesis protein A